jgi:toxin ParE1/3/4
MSSYRYSSQANADVEEIALYIFELNPPAAHQFLDNLEQTCQRLAAHPDIGRLRSDLGAGLRSFSIGNYLIFYSLMTNGIEIARVIYGGRDLPRIFKP